MSQPGPPNQHAFTEEQRKAVYAAIVQRRDIRHFRGDPVPDEVLARILQAGNHAPSVGFCQPWNFLVIHDLERRKQLRKHVEEERLAGALRFDGERRDAYLKLKLEGIVDAPLNLCITCDRERFGPAVLGKNTIIDSDIYSSVTAVQNIWLAARAEGVGVGWVSILRNAFLREFLQLPPKVQPLAYLCMGYPESFPPRPTLETKGWLPRLALADLVYENGWGKEPSPGLKQRLEDPQ